MKRVAKFLKTKLKCPDEDCRRKFGKYKALVRHCREIHGYEDEDLKAKLGNVKIELEAKTKVKRTGSDPAAPNKCPDCELCYWLHKSLVKHCVEVHNSNSSQKFNHIPQRYSCNFCPEMFKFHSSVINHT